MSAARPSFVLVHSPLVGPATWGPTADAIRTSGYHVIVPSLAGFEAEGPPYYEKVATRVADAVRDAPQSGPLVVVGHSGAGALLPAVASALPTSVSALLFVDALLPHPGSSWMDTAPSALREQLRSLAVDGKLPPWHEWFPPGTVEALIPDADLRAAVVAEIPRLPLAYFEEPAPVVESGDVPGGYLQLSVAYGPFADEAERRGWPTIRENADHLAIVTKPSLVADQVLDLVGRVLTSAA